MANRVDPYRKFRYRLEIDGITQAGFSEVSGFDASVDVVEYREGTDTITPRKLTGLAKYGNVTFKWGVTDSMEMYNWIAGIINGQIVRKNITIVSVNEAGQDVATWQVINAWPAKYTAPDFSATASEVALESLEVAHEGLLRKK